MEDELRNHPVLTDEIQKLMAQLSYVPCTTAVKSSQSNGIAERFVKTMKENYIAFISKSNARTAAKMALYNLAVARVLHRIVCRVIARYGNICGSGPVMG